MFNLKLNCLTPLFGSVFKNKHGEENESLEKAKEKKADGKKDDDEANGGTKKRKHTGDDGAGEAKKKAKPGPKPSKQVDKESIQPILAKGATRVSLLQSS